MLGFPVQKSVTTSLWHYSGIDMFVKDCEGRFANLVLDGVWDVDPSARSSV